MRLKDKVALVTGAGRGIGQAIALAFAREGAEVAVADVDPTTARATANKIGRAKALALQMDVADSGSVRDGFDAIDRAWRRLDVAVTNAAVEPIAPFLELNPRPGNRCHPHHTLSAWLARMSMSSEVLLRLIRLANFLGQLVPTHSVADLRTESPLQ